jgi:hypothetical protein
MRGAAASTVLVVGAALAASAAAALPPQPHRLEYRVAWNGIPAGRATVEITPGEVGGRNSLFVEASARTNAFVDLFWAFRGTVRATLLGDQLIPLHFAFDRVMTGRPYTTWVDFADERAHSVYIKGDRRRDQDLDGADVIDPITAVFRARLSGAGPGDTLRYDVWTGEARLRVQLDVKAPEQIDVPAGRFTALPVVPQVWRLGERTELDPNLRRATIWVSDDPGRTLLRIRSEVLVGAVTLDLVKIEAPPLETAARPRAPGRASIN